MVTCSGKIVWVYWAAISYHIGGGSPKFSPSTSILSPSLILNTFWSPKIFPISRVPTRCITPPSKLSFRGASITPLLKILVRGTPHAAGQTRRDSSGIIRVWGIGAHAVQCPSLEVRRLWVSFPVSQTRRSTFLHSRILRLYSSNFLIFICALREFAIGLI